MTVHYFKSSDAGAPVLTGQTGALIELLDACLVDGYGDLDPAGWEIAFSGTDKRVYRSSLIGGTRHYYRVRNDGAGPGTSQFGYLTGYHDMTGVDTGSDPYPASGQRAHGVALASANGTDAVPREWSIVATEKTVFVFIAQSTSSSTLRICSAFGEFSPASPSDVGHAFVAGFGDDAIHAAAISALNRNAGAPATHQSAYIASDPSGASISVEAGFGEAGKTGVGNYGGGGPPFPNPHITGAVLLPILVHDGLGIRGGLDHLFSPAHAHTTSYPLNDVEFTGLDGRRYCWQRLWRYSGGSQADSAVVARISE